MDCARCPRYTSFCELSFMLGWDFGDAVALSHSCTFRNPDKLDVGEIVFLLCCWCDNCSHVLGTVT